MKKINLLSLAQASNSLGQGDLDDFLSFHEIKIKNEEIDDLKILLNFLYNPQRNLTTYDNFYVGYKIPQIGKEFDLIRFGNNYIVNIELKKTCTEEKIKYQLVRNRYYLSFIGREIFNLTFISSTNELYFLNSHNNLEKVSSLFLEKLLNQQIINQFEIADKLFNPSDYLVSPFNSTKKFLNKEYFLTHQQEDIKSNILQNITNTKAAVFISITGSAGTGKTLLTYDIAKYFIETKNKAPLIVHCGQINSGQMELMSHGWKIISIKYYKNYDLSNYDLIIIDEAQRIYTSQLDDITQKIQSANGKCILSYDKLQTLATWEEAREIDKKISNIQNIFQYKLSEKIRTNKEIAAFIKSLFDQNKNIAIPNNENIEIVYFNLIDDAKSYLNLLDENDWEILRFTPSQYKKEHHSLYSDLTKKTSHQVIGQEFDNVAVTMDSFFLYDASGKLTYYGDVYYNPAKMLFQNITRTRKKLKLVIIGNIILLRRCLSILK